MLTVELHQAIADELRAAERDRVPVPPLVGRYEGIDAADAYQIQLLNIERRVSAGAAVVGHKVGLSSKAMQQMMGVDEPDYGHLLDDMRAVSPVAAGRYCYPRVEPEVAAGRSDAVLGNPVIAVAWLARKVAGFGVRLRAGHVILPGSCTRAIDARPGDVFRGDFAGLGSVSLTFAKGDS